MSSVDLAPLHPTVDTVPGPLPPHHLRNLLTILRRANDSYCQLAIDYRTSRRSTYHARTCASKIGLTVDIHKAINCPQHEVSRTPLPVIDTSLGPHTPPARSVVQDLYGPFDDNYVISATAPLKRISRRDLPPITIPAVGSDRRRVVAPVVSPSSYFSAVTPDSIARETPVFNIHVWDSNMLEHVDPDREVLDIDEGDIIEEIVLTPISEDGFDWEDDEDRLRDAIEGMHCPQGLGLRYPTPTSPVSPSPGSSDSEFTSSSSSSGLTTPSEGSPIMVCNKRKSKYRHEHYSTEITLGRKPPKYLRKDIKMGHLPLLEISLPIEMNTS